MKSTRSFSWAHIELNAEITSFFSPVNSSRWLQGTKDPVHTWFKWQTSRKMLQLIRWKLCLVFLEKSRRCIYFLSKFTELLDQKQAQSLWNRFSTIIMVSRFCGAVVKLAICCWNYVFAARWVYYLICMQRNEMSKTNGENYFSRHI